MVLKAALHFESRLYHATFGLVDHREGFDAFLQKRAPNGRTSEVSGSGTTVYRKHLKCGIAGVVQQAAGCGVRPSIKWIPSRHPLFFHK